MNAQKACILIIDDDPYLRKSLADILKLKGYKAVTAARGKEGLAMAAEHHISLALIDLRLPDMSGLEVMTRLKAASPLIEVIILTGHASLDSAIEATKKGAFSYLLKPYEIEDLLLDIQHGVESQQAQEEILRLASYPRLNPNPVVEIGDTHVTYLNPAAERLFPELKQTGLTHPLLRGIEQAREKLADEGGDLVRDVEVGDSTYEQHISYIHELGLLRIYMLDISERKRAEREIRLLATTDALTGILNRREFSAILNREAARASRYGSPLSLIMYDIDYFKQINDSYGHDVGDQILKDLTDLIRTRTRAVDVLARWGGEEFMLLMPQLSSEPAVRAAEKLRTAILHHSFQDVAKVTVSFGITVFQPGEPVKELLKRADDALYQAKRKGRNRVEVILANEKVNG